MFDFTLYPPRPHINILIIFPYRDRYKPSKHSGLIMREFVVCYFYVCITVFRNIRLASKQLQILLSLFVFSCLRFGKNVNPEIFILLRFMQLYQDFDTGSILFFVWKMSEYYYPIFSLILEGGTHLPVKVFQHVLSHHVEMHHVISGIDIADNKGRLQDYNITHKTIFRGYDYCSLSGHKKLDWKDGWRDNASNLERLTDNNTALGHTQYHYNNKHNRQYIR